MRPHGGPPLWTGVFGTGIYGGYFGAAQGVILLALLGIAIPEDMQRLNALKNVLAALVNGVAAVVFLLLRRPWRGCRRCCSRSARRPAGSSARRSAGASRRPSCAA